MKDGSWLIFLVIIIVIITIFVGIFYQPPVSSYTIQLKSLNDGSQTEGSFFLGCGAIHQTPYFVSYVALKNGGYQLKQFEAEYSTIYMDSYQPYVVVHTRSGMDYTYDFHVPPGTIVERYVLDGRL